MRVLRPSAQRPTLRRQPCKVSIASAPCARHDAQMSTFSQLQFWRAGAGKIARAWCVPVLLAIATPAGFAAQDRLSCAAYFVGATFSDTVGGKPEVIEISPDSIQVKPLPELPLDFF